MKNIERITYSVKLYCGATMGETCMQLGYFLVYQLKQIKEGEKKRKKKN